MRGCKDEDTSLTPYQIDGETIWRCPKALHEEMPIDDKNLMNQWLTAYYYSERGILPRAGGWQDQDRKVVEAIPIIHRLVSNESKRKSKSKEGS